MWTSRSDLVLAARYFDGKTSTAHAVDLTLDGQDVLLRNIDLELRWPLRDVHLSERLGNTPRLLTYAGGGHCEIADQAGLETLLAMIDPRRSWMDRVQHSSAWSMLAAVLIVFSLLAAYRYLLPWGAEVIAQRIPGSVLQSMGNSTLETLDRVMLQPTKLDVARQRALRSAFARLHVLPDARLPYRIEFRSGPGIGANAFALPDGTIVLLDELLALTKDDNEIIAVLAHERGHVERRHAMRMVLQSSVVGLLLTWYMGDVSSLLATVPAVVVQAKYSRDMEREADEYAERSLRLNGLSPCLLATALGKLESAHVPLGKQANDTVKENVALDYLSSHPATRERISLLCPAQK